MARDETGTARVEPRRMAELGRHEAMDLLGSVSLGRIVFTRNALPNIRPVNHVLDHGEIVIRTHVGSALTMQVGRAGSGGVVVAYEAEAIDPHDHLGWCVIVTGYARLVIDRDDLARYQDLLEPWVDLTEEMMDCAVRIRPDVVTGLRLTAAASVESALDAPAVERG